MESDPFREVAKSILSDLFPCKEAEGKLLDLIKVSKEKTGQGRIIFNFVKGWEFN